MKHLKNVNSEKDNSEKMCYPLKKVKPDKSENNKLEKDKSEKDNYAQEKSENGPLWKGRI